MGCDRNRVQYRLSRVLICREANRSGAILCPIIGAPMRSSGPGATRSNFHRERRAQDRSMTNCWPSSRRAGGGHSSVGGLMRILALAILTNATASVAPSARAQTYAPAYPVCLQIYQGWNDYYFECAYTSLPQCNASASGRAAQCSVNQCYA